MGILLVFEVYISRRDLLVVFKWVELDDHIFSGLSLTYTSLRNDKTSKYTVTYYRETTL